MQTKVKKKNQNFKLWTMKQKLRSSREGGRLNKESNAAGLRVQLGIIQQRRHLIFFIHLPTDHRIARKELSLLQWMPWKQRQGPSGNEGKRRTKGIRARTRVRTRRRRRMRRERREIYGERDGIHGGVSDW